jgi:hydroxymethylpyrimidine pyrophosphatase-like HAD family hydrolase
MHFIGRANLSKRSRKDLKRAMPHLSVSMSKPFFLAQNGIDKAKYKIVAEKLGIHQSEIIAVGNAGNDLAMIEYGLGVWVDNVDPV